MKTKYILHKLPEGFIVTSDEISHKGDIVINNLDNLIGEATRELNQGEIKDKEYSKVIAQQDQIDFSGLSEEEQKRIGWFDLYAEAQNYAISTKSPNREAHRAGYVKGFQKAQELLSNRKFNSEDIMLAFNNGYSQFTAQTMDCEDYIQSLSQSKSWQVELEMETIKGKYIGRKQISVTPSGEPTYINEGYEEILQPKLTNSKITITKIL
jgi:hypothetical protein